MAKSKPKIQKRLAKLVLAALLFTEGTQFAISPSVVEAGGTVSITGFDSGNYIVDPPDSVVANYWFSYGGVRYPSDPSVTTFNISGDLSGAGAIRFAGNNVWGGEAKNRHTNFNGNNMTVLGVYGGVGYNNAEYSVHCKASDNYVTIGENATITGDVVAGLAAVYNNGYLYAEDVLSSNNTVTIDGGNIAGKVFGGQVISDSSYAGDYGVGSVEENKVIINNGTFGAAAAGTGSGVAPASSGSGFVLDPSGSIIAVSGSVPQTATDIAGGYTDEGNVTKNTVTIDGGTFNAGIRLVGSEGGNDPDRASSGAFIYGGYTFKGDATKNEVNITNGTFEAGVVDSDTNVHYAFPAMVYGGYTADGSAEYNKVNIDGGTFKSSDDDFYGAAFVIGGRGTTAANYNEVTINGGTFSRVVGGTTTNDTDPIAILDENASTTFGPANYNTVTIKNGTLGYEITHEGETYKFGGMVFGGMSFTEASNNTVTIKGGNVDGAMIFGGVTSRLDMDEAAASVNTAVKADNNTVNVLTPSANYAALFGGVTGISESGLIYGSGNTLNVAAKDVTTYVVGGFDNMNFYLPSNIANGDTMLTVTTPKNVTEMLASGLYYAFELTLPEKYNVEELEDGIDEDGTIKVKAKPTDLKGVTFGVAALKGVNLKKGDKVTLITDENGLTTDSSLKTKDSKELGKAEFLQQNNMTTEEKYELSIKKEGDNAIVTTVDDIIENETDPNARKSPVETRAAVVTMINAAGDLLAGQGMANAADAAAAERSGDSAEAAPRSGGFAPFAAVGFGNLRAESGSHVDTKSIGLNLGFAREIENKSGKLLIGPVLEYGHGNYDSYQDNGMKADGKASYWGIGVIAKQTNNSGFYYEGSLRVGRTKSDYGSDSIVTNSHISYDSSATYWAAHLGAGVLKDIGHNNTLDYYGKYFYSHTGSDSTTIYRNGEDFDRVDFDGVNSNRIRVGARITHALNERNKIYGGLAYQYEFSGEARATYREGAAPSPGVKGSSGMIELGWQVKPGKKSPMAIDIGVAGWVGKQRGITANVQANWTF